MEVETVLDLHHAKIETHETSTQDGSDQEGLKYDDVTEEECRADNMAGASPHSSQPSHDGGHTTEVHKEPAMNGGVEAKDAALAANESIHNHEPVAGAGDKNTRSRSRSPRRTSGKSPSRHRSRTNGRTSSRSPKRARSSKSPRRRSSKGSKSPAKSRSRSRSPRKRSSKSKSKSKSPSRRHGSKSPRRKRSRSRKRSPGSKRRSRSRSGSPKRRRSSPSRRRAGTSPRRPGGAGGAVLHASRAYAHRGRDGPTELVPGWLYTCGLRPSVMQELEKLYVKGLLRPGGPDLDPATMDHLRPLPEEAGLSAIKELASLNFTRLWNLSAFFVGICKARCNPNHPRNRRRSRSPPRAGGPPPWMESPPGRMGPGAGRGRSPPGRQHRSPLSPRGGPMGRPGMLSPPLGAAGGGFRGGSPPGRARQASMSPAGRRERDPYVMVDPPVNTGGYGGYGQGCGGAAGPAAGRSPIRELPGPPGPRPGYEQHPGHLQHHQQRSPLPPQPLKDVPPAAYQQPSPVSPVQGQDNYPPASGQYRGHGHGMGGRYDEPSRTPAEAAAAGYGEVKITSLAAWDAPSIPAHSNSHHQQQPQQQERGWPQQEQGRYGGYDGRQHQSSSYPPAASPGANAPYPSSNGYPADRRGDPYSRAAPQEATGGYGGGYPPAAGGPAAIDSSYSPDGPAGYGRALPPTMFDVKQSNIEQWPPGSAVRSAVTDYVKELLKPVWKQQRISREAYKAVAKKSVEKVLCSLAVTGPQALPDSQQGVDLLFTERAMGQMGVMVEGYVSHSERFGLESLLAAP